MSKELLKEKLREFITFEHDYREDEDRYPRDFWHTRINFGMWLSTEWYRYGKQGQYKVPEKEKRKAEEDLLNYVVQDMYDFLLYLVEDR
jgi:hypothetical protein